MKSNIVTKGFFYYGQFHQHFASTFAPISLCQKSLTYTSSTKKLCAKLSYKKATREMLVILTPNVVRKEV
jgi:hypothetical protein